MIIFIIKKIANYVIDFVIIIVGLYFAIFVLDKILLYLNINPLPHIETLEQLEKEGWVVPLSYQLVTDSLISLSVVYYLYRNRIRMKTSMIVTGIGLFTWLIQLFWVNNARTMLNSYQFQYWVLHFVFVVCMYMYFLWKQATKTTAA